MNVISIIPARSGSKGIKDKNLQEVGGRKLLDWSIQASLQSHEISRTIVSTDSEEYAKIAVNLGAEVPFMRPKILATDFSPDLDFIRHAVGELCTQGFKADFIVHLRPTTPFRDPTVVDHAIREFVQASGEFSALRSVHEMSESAYKTLEIDSHGRLIQVFVKNPDIEQSNQARQSFPVTYSPNGYVDVISTEYLERTGKLHGNQVKAFITERVLEVDDSTDLEMLNISLKLSTKPYSRLFGVSNE